MLYAAIAQRFYAFIMKHDGDYWPLWATYRAAEAYAAGRWV